MYLILETAMRDRNAPEVNPREQRKLEMSQVEKTPKNNSDGGKSRQDLDTALTALNPDFRPL